MLNPTHAESAIMKFCIYSALLLCQDKESVIPGQAEALAKA